MPRIVPRPSPWNTPAIAVLTGVGVGTLGGLIGLGGAEFRLPILVAVFGYGLRRAVGLNLTISLVTVLAGATSRILFGHATVNASSVVGVGLPMAIGGMLGAYAGSTWLARMSDLRVHQAIRWLLVGIGVLLLAEAVTSWMSTGLPLGVTSRIGLAVICGTGIGIVSSLLGVAGGELIIPTLLFLFGIDIRSAGTLSLLVSIPTVVVGVWRQRISLRSGGDTLRAVVVPMALGSVVGAILGGILVAFVMPSVVKAILGLALITSAFRITRGRHQP